MNTLRKIYPADTMSNIIRRCIIMDTISADEVAALMAQTSYTRAEAEDHIQAEIVSARETGWAGVLKEDFARRAGVIAP